MTPFTILTILGFLFLFIIVYRIEDRKHHRDVQSIPIRILVNGSRGKSSVVRLIAAGLRASGKEVYAKTTGTSTRFIGANGTEEPIMRIDMPTIREQIKVIHRVAQNDPDVIVIECMALRPQLQRTESFRIVKPTLVVITNVRADHLDIMGPTIRDIAKTFVRVVPQNCTVFTAEVRTLDVFVENTQDKNIDIFTTDPGNISDAVIAKFPYIEHKENVSLALDVCKYLGVDESTALHGMFMATPDPGVSQIYTIDINGKSITYICALAANDPESASRIWQAVKKDHPETNLLINCRKDRISRSVQYAQFIKNLDVDLCILTGSGTNVLARRLKNVIERKRIMNLGDKQPEQVYNEVSKRIADRSLLFAIGNAMGYGSELHQYFVKRGKTDAP